MITPALVEERLRALRARHADAYANLRALEGAIGELEFWLDWLSRQEAADEGDPPPPDVPDTPGAS